jgi:hypothetical protein
MNEVNINITLFTNVCISKYKYLFTNVCMNEVNINIYLQMCV